jgi:hypothetical protein
MFFRYVLTHDFLVLITSHFNVGENSSRKKEFVSLSNLVWFLQVLKGFLGGFCEFN